MVRQRYALLACLCAVGAFSFVPASSALAAGRSRLAAFHQAHRHGARQHAGSCVAGGRRHRAARGHARRASFRTGAPPPHRRRGLGCSRRRTHHAHRRAPRHAGGRPRRGPAAAHSSACPDANLTPTAGNLDRVRAATLCLINRERTGHGESALNADPRLACAAQAHSEEMASADYFEHVGPRGDTPLSRVRACGYVSGGNVGYEVGENIAWGTLWLATPRATVSSWMASPGHRANILDARYRDTAIGVAPRPLASLARGQPGAMYTQDFGVILGR